ncbi:MAG: 3D-(3,5/4)-trihydroxycyclohexane-1,2-dione acylhydrolase (decyclizing) [Actinobacteria bacterium]|nr:3D-(3,5/4)-trihydroxycyclohexane-1,2-dione acylhydrolase (decyclizing) [Actinomycetota bacterium]MDQ3532031.1 3D-(3,5/4)-trihydroxycyclohexane-1,2-dione acylhydrolase (decyclizing) [Actinomycetota bacterium]
MNKSTRHLTMAQALVEFLAVQYVERDGVDQRFFAGCFGIFGHGNVAGMGQALHQAGERLRYYQARNEQAMVHTAAGYARMKNRLATFACTSSIGPGATNMVTGAAAATINRLPVLLLPGDVFASRGPDPALQQLEVAAAPEMSVNDCFKPVSRYWDRINRPEQLVVSLLGAMRVLTDPAETGAVTLALPQDVQTQAWDYPAELFERRVWHVARPHPEPAMLARAADLVKGARRPLIVAGGGVIYSEATQALKIFAEATGIPVAETQAGKGSLPHGHPCALGAVGVTGTAGAIAVAREADLVIGVGTRWTDFTTASHSGFANPEVRFININVAAPDAAKLGGVPLIADARVALEALREVLSGFSVDAHYKAEVETHVREWDAEVERIYHLDHSPLPSQGEIIGAVNDAAAERDVVVCAAGSMPGDLHKLWRARDAKSYHVEYGYSCMGYEVAGGLGAKLAAPDREVFVMVGDGSYLMMAQELVTAIQEHQKLIVVLVQNHGYASIGGLSRSIGSEGFGTRYRYRSPDGRLEGDVLPVDLAANAASLGARVIEAGSVAELRDGLKQAVESDTTTVVHIEADPHVSVPVYGSWWDVAVAEVSESGAIGYARAEYEKAKAKERTFL